jgi:hypothetical protein
MMVCHSHEQLLMKGQCLEMILISIFLVPTRSRRECSDEHRLYDVTCIY